MDPLSTASFGLGTISAVGGLVTSLFGNEAKRQADLERARRANLSNDQYLGTATNRAASSGVQMSGSMASYLNAMGEEFKRQNDFNVKQANEAADLSNLGSVFGAASNFSSSLFNYGAANNWWHG